MSYKQGSAAVAGVIALGVLVLLVIVGSIAVGTLNKERTAHAALEQYLNALATGDATTAASLLEADWRPSAGPDLLTDEVLANAEELISDISVVSITDWGTATLEGSYTLNGQRYTQTFRVREGEPEWGFLKTYQVELPDRVWVTPSSVSHVDVELAGVPLKPATPGVYLFPAVYPVAVPDHTYVELTQDVFVVTGDERPERVEVVAAPALIEQAQQQVNAFFDECVEMATPEHVVPGCHDMRGAGEPGTWELLEYPTVEHGGVGNLVSFIARDGRAALTLDAMDSPYDRSFDFFVDVDIRDGEPNIQVRAG